MTRNVVAWGLALALALPAAAMEVAGVSLPDTVTVGGATLKLNGMGVRKKLWIKVYVGGLYLAAASHDTATILAADTPRRMVMHFLYHEVSQAKLTDAWREGFENNSAASLPALQARLDTFCSWWPAMKSGEEAVLTYVPGTGTRLEIDGKELGTIPGKDFADALFLVWLGDKPADGGLKEGLLAK
jgi:hypothetical protein